MMTFAAQIAPQRSTQYADLAATLAPQELRLSPLGRQLTNLEPLSLGGQPYLQFDLPHAPDDAQRYELGTLAMSSAFFRLYPKLGSIDGPLLKPLETDFQPAFPSDLMMTRRYRGKTNECFTHFMCNIARASSRFQAQSWSELRLFDPLAGGGTTLLAGLVLGAHVAGVEQSDKDVETTAAFIQQYMREARIGCQAQKGRLPGAGRRWNFELGRRPRRQCVLAHGDTRDSAQLLSGFKPQLIVTDLPYGIQHHGQLIDLLTAALPVWTSLLPVGGVVTFAWESTRFPRTEMIALVEQVSRLKVFNDAPYSELTHRVDRVIKQRDVIVARK